MKNRGSRTDEVPDKSGKAVMTAPFQMDINKSGNALYLLLTRVSGESKQDLLVSYHNRVYQVILRTVCSFLILS